MTRFTSLILMMGVAAGLSAQTLSLGTVSVAPGGTAHMNIMLTSGGSQYAGVQCDLVYDKTNLTITGVTGSAASGASKSASHNYSLSSTSIRFIVAGLGQDVIPDGDVVDLTIVANANAPATTYPVTVTNTAGTDPNGNPLALGASGGSVTVIAVLSITGPSTIPSGYANETYTNTQVNAVGGTPPYTWSYSGFPTGMSVNSTGVITGTPSVSGSFSPQVKVTDSVGGTATQNYSLSIGNALTVTAPTGATLPVATQGAAYTALTATASGGSGSNTWTGSGFPGGLGISSAGVISGTPTANGAFNSVKITVTDAGGGSASQTYSLTVNPPLVVTSPSSPPTGAVGEVYPSGVSFSATGGSGSYTWGATGLPNGLGIGATGAITGTPAAGSNGNYTVTATATDGNGIKASNTASITINAALSITSSATLTVGVVNETYTGFTAAATGGVGTLTWSATGLPTGLNISSGGVIGGTVTASANGYSPVLKVTDANGYFVTQNASLTVNAGLAVTAPTGATLPVATQGAAYTALTATASGGSGSNTWTGSGFPGGMGISSAGVISGTPTANGTFSSVTLTVTDAGGGTASQTYSLTVNPPLVVTSPSNPPTGAVGEVYPSGVSFSATGGSGSYTWGATGLPNGLNIGSTGAITGTPAAGSNGNYTVTATATDGNGIKASNTAAITINAALSITSSATLTVGVVNETYTGFTAAATGGVGTLTWSATGLPTGLNISSGGVISGTVTASANGYSPVLKVTDSNGFSVTQNASLTVNAGLVVTAPTGATLPVATQGAAYTALTATASGGSGSNTWTGSGFPGGLGISSAGVISGTPTANGTFNSVKITVTDAGGGSASQTYSLTVNPPLVVTSPSSPPTGAVGEVYPSGVSFSATGGSGSYTWGATGLPNGLGIGATGAITGTPAAGSNGNYTVTATATDGNGIKASNTAAITINAALSITSSASLPAGAVGETYTGATAAATGGVGAYTWSATGLPPGLGISSSGAITGSPTGGANNYSPVLKVTDSTGFSVTQNATLSVNAALAVTAPTGATLPVATQGAAYTALTATASGGSGSNTWTGSGFPAGLSISGSGSISGTPTANGTFNSVKITVTDAGGGSASQTYSLIVNPPLVVTSPASPPIGASGEPYAGTSFSATGGSGTYTWTATNLPPGLTIGSTGAITGTPTGNANTYTVTATAKDSNGVTASNTASIQINPFLAVSCLPNPLPTAALLEAYAGAQCTASGGVGTYTYSASTAFPSGININSSTGAVSGTPTVTGSFGPVVKVTDTGGGTAYQQFLTLTVNPALAITNPVGASLPVATVSAAYTALTAAASGGTGTNSWSGTGFPAGLSISSAGVISGTPTASGTFSSVKLTVTDIGGGSASQTYSIQVNPQLVVSAPASASLPLGAVGEPYTSVQFAATGGSGTYTGWSATGVPPGLNFNTNTGSLSGTPTGSGGSYTVVVTVTDSNSVTANRSYSMTVNPALAVNGPSTLPAGTASLAYSATLTAVGGSGVYTWSATGLPANLSLASATGVIGGSPVTNAGSPFTVTVTVTDSASFTATKTYSLVVNPLAPLAISGPSSLPAGIMNVAYPATTMTATGGNGGYSWSAAGLPPGLAINPSTGTISGTPATNAASPYSVVVTVTDSISNTINKTYSLVVNPTLAIIGPPSLPTGYVNQAYSATTVIATGGSGRYTWSATGMPPGLSINSSNGTVSGTPTASSSVAYNVQVTVTDSNSYTANKGYALTINGPLTINGSSLPAGTVNEAYTPVKFTATGGTGNYTWAATGLAPGLSINSATGTVAGTPTSNAGSPYSVVISVSDGLTAATYPVTLVINSGLSITGPASLPAGVVNVAYPATTVTASGGTGSYTWFATGLPPGLTINSSGTITGTPASASGPSPFTPQVTVTDSTGATATRSYTVAISGSLTISGPSSLPAATANVPYSGASITATGGSGSYTWSASGLPPGLGIGSSSGNITGTPTTSNGSPFSVRVTVTDTTSATASRTYSLTVNPALTISGPASLPAGVVGAAYPATAISASGGSGIYTWAAIGLPLGLSIGSGTGVISGTPANNSGSPFNVLITVTDSNSATSSRSYSLAVSGFVAVPSITAVLNAAGGQSLLAPGTWASIYGSNFASPGFTDDWTKWIVSGKLPTTIDGVSVSIGGSPAYLSYLSPGQINMLIPSGVGMGSMSVTVTTPTGTSQPFAVTLQQVSPAFFPWPAGQPVATHIDYTWAAKNGTINGVTTVPAKPGETIILWGTGFGPTVPPAPDGVALPSTPLYYTANPVTLTIGGAPASVYATALAPSFGGLFQVVVTVPTSLPNGDYGVVATIDGVATPTATTLTVHN